MDPNASSPTDPAPDQPWRWFDALFEAALDAVLIADSEGRYVDANPAAQALLGYSRDEILALSVSDVTALDPARPFTEQWERFLSAGTLNGDYQVRGKAGTDRTGALRAVANATSRPHLWTMPHFTEVAAPKQF